MGVAYEVIRLPYLIRCLLQPPLRRIDTPIAFINVLLHVPHVVIFKAVFAFIGSGFIFGLERFTVDFRTWPQVLFCVREEIVRTGTDKEGTANFGICEGKLCMARGSTSTHKLLWKGISRWSKWRKVRG